jgi:hypothetical protein
MSRVVRFVAVCALSAVLTVVLSGCFSSSSPIDTGERPGDTDGYIATLPSDWPAEIPLPADMKLESAGKVELPEGTTYSAVYSGDADPASVNEALSSALTAKGFTAEANFGGGADGGVSTWKNAGYSVQLTVTQEGSGTIVNITALRTS